jgi:hypothetical protein
MALQQVWIHGNNVVMRFPGGKGDPMGSPYTPGHQMNGVPTIDSGSSAPGLIEWSDVVGLHGPEGVTFRGRGGQTTNQFFACVPTPAAQEDAAMTPTWGTYLRAGLARVLLRFKSDPGIVTITRMRVFDGANDYQYPFPRMSSAMGLGLTGDYSNTWLENINYFPNHNPLPLSPLYTGVCIVFDVLFSAEGNITFNSVGCDFHLKEGL